MDKKPSFLWSLAVGAGFAILQALIFVLNFSNINTGSVAINYLFFFVGGSLIGLGLIYLLRRSETKGMYRGTVIGFVISIPFALFGMMMGGLTSPLGSIFLSVSPGVFIPAVGYFLGRIFSKKTA